MSRRYSELFCAAEDVGQQIFFGGWQSKRKVISVFIIDKDMKSQKSKTEKGLFESNELFSTSCREITLESFQSKNSSSAGAPFLIVCCGMGRDSLAVLILLKKLKIRPDLIIFADVGNEKPKTYGYLPVLRNWLQTAGFPDLTIVRAERTRDESLESMCLRLGVFPSLAYRTSHRCSVQWKIEAINKYLKFCEPVINARRQGRLLVRAIGFEAGEIYRARRVDVNSVLTVEDKKSGKFRTTAFAPSLDEGYISFFPLIEKQIDFDGVLSLILEEGLSVPVKSACFFCPASKPDEIATLSKEEPHLFFRALVMERVVQRNRIKVHRTIQGLNFGKPWLEMKEAEPFKKHLDVVIEIFGLDRAVGDGIANPQNEEWKPKAHRVELFRKAFGTKERLQTFLKSGEVDLRFAPSNNPFLQGKERSCQFNLFEAVEESG